MVNHDGGEGTAPDPLVWSAGAPPKRRRLVHVVRDLAMLPGPPAIWTSGWFNVPASAIGAQDVADWPHSVSLLVKWVAFWGSLHWLVGGADLGVGGVSYVEMLILYELWAGERLALKKAHPRYLRPGRPISVSAVPFGPGIDIWRSCRFIGALMRSLCSLSGGLGGFVPCAIGANNCRLRVGSPPGHGRVLFRFPPRFCPALLAGTLPLKYCAVRFASRVPTWRSPVSGLAVLAESAGLVVLLLVGREFD